MPGKQNEIKRRSPSIGVLPPKMLVSNSSVSILLLNEKSETPTIQMKSNGVLVIQVILTDGRKLDIAVLIEHDNGNEFGERFRNKLHAIHAMLQAEAYKERFGVEYVTVAFTTFKGPKRCDRMREVACERSEERRVGKKCRSRWSPYH